MSTDCPPIIFGCTFVFPLVSSNKKPKIYMGNSKCYMACINNNENSGHLVIYYFNIIKYNDSYICFIR